MNDKMSFANIAETASGGLSSSGSTTLLLDDITQASLNEHAKAINSLTDLTWNLYENGMPVPFVSINKKNADGTDVTSTTGNYDGLGAKGNASIAIGIEASTIDSATGAVALGTKAAARGVGTIAIGNSAQTMTGSGAGDNYNISIGDNAKTVGASADGDRSSIALGHNATAGFASQTSNKEGGAIAIGDAASAGNQDAIAIGSNSKTYNGRSVAMGNAAKTFGDKSIAIGQEAKTGAYDANNAPVGSHAESAVAIGYLANATKSNSSAIGKGAKAQGNNSVAVGNDASTGAEAINASAFGKQASATGDTSLALGAEAKASGKMSIAEGWAAEATQESNIAIGRLAKATGTNAVTLGMGGIGAKNAGTRTSTLGHANDAGDKLVDSVAVGTFNFLQNPYLAATGTISGAIAIGSYNVVGSTDSVAIGNRNSIGVEKDAGQKGNIVLGNDIRVNYNTRTFSSQTDGTKVIGSQGGSNTANSINNVLVGNKLNVYGSENSVFIGSSIENPGYRINNAVVIGNKANASSSQAVAIGNEAKASYNGVSIGTSAYAAFSESVGIGASAKASASSAVAMGNSAEASGASAVAMGNLAEASGASAVAMGNSAEASGARGIAIGSSRWDATSSNGFLTKATAEDAIAIGAGAEASGVSSISIGTSNKVTGAKSGAIGDPNVITGDGSYAIGNDNQIEAANAFVLGNNVTVRSNFAGAVALGNASAVRSAVQTASATIKGITYGTFAGSTPATGDVVSVGSDTIKRQIQNVAAGQITQTSTDAINGSQLYATNNTRGNLAGSTASNLGGNVTVNVDGSLTAPSYVINGNTYNNVGAALSAATTHFVSIKGEAADNNYKNDPNCNNKLNTRRTFMQ